MRYIFTKKVLFDHTEGRNNVIYKKISRTGDHHFNKNKTEILHVFYHKLNIDYKDMKING